jgi:hypothetical protein
MVKVAIREATQGRSEEFLDSWSDPVPYFVVCCQLKPLCSWNFTLFEPVFSEFEAIFDIPHLAHVKDINQNFN